MLFKRVEKEIGIEADASALEIICMDFCGGMSLVERVRISSDDALKTIVQLAVERLGPTGEAGSEGVFKR